jgi:riboflavin transporter FmnP
MKSLMEMLEKNVGFILISLAMMLAIYFIAFASEKLIEKKKQMKFSSQKTKVNKMVLLAMFSAISLVLRFIEFPVPFIAPPFYKLDFSDIPALIGSFMLGPTAGVVIEALKNILHVLLAGSETVCVGDFANFLIGAILVLPSSIIYHLSKTKKSAMIGLIVGSIAMIFSGMFLNIYYLLPKYSVLYGMPISAFIEMGKAINGNITDIYTFAAMAVLPFNLIKAVIVSIITAILYKYLSKHIKVQ